MLRPFFRSAAGGRDDGLPVVLAGQIDADRHSLAGRLAQGLGSIRNDYQPYKGVIGGRVNGVLLANAPGEAVAYAMFNLEDRGPMIIEPGEKVYAGMIIGIHTRDNDLEVNVLKGKKLTNIRAAGKDEAVKLTPPIRMTLERALAWIQDDELVEVTPKTIRLRKLYLDPNERKRFEKSSKAVGAA